MDIDSKTDRELLTLWEQLYKDTDTEVTGVSQELFILSLVYTELCQRGYKSKEGVWAKEEAVY